MTFLFATYIGAHSSAALHENMISPLSLHEPRHRNGEGLWSIADIVYTYHNHSTWNIQSHIIFKKSWVFRVLPPLALATITMTQPK